MSADIEDINAGEPDRLEERYKVERLTPSRSGKDHTDCRYFVLDLTHDPIAREAAAYYAAKVDDQGRRELCLDIRQLIHTEKMKSIMDNIRGEMP